MGRSPVAGAALLGLLEVSNPRPTSRESLEIKQPEERSLTVRVVCAWCNRNPYTFDVVCFVCGRPGAHVTKLHPNDDRRFVTVCIPCGLNRPTVIASHGICIECR